MTIKSLLLISTITIGSLLLAGCAPQIVETEPLRPIAQNSQSQTSNNGLQLDNQTQVLGSTAQASPSDISLTTSSVNSTPSTQPVVTNSENPHMKTLKDFAQITATQATLTTTKGDVVIELYPDKAPLTVTNFLTLAKSKFYDGIKFHRIIAGFMAQVGDPLTKDDSQKSMWGTGGPGYTIQDEFAPDLQFVGPGVVAMANTGMPNTGGSQFFITFADTTWLNGKHAIFGKVTQGMNVVNQLVIGDAIQSISFK